MNKRKNSSSQNNLSVKKGNAQPESNYQEAILKFKKIKKKELTVPAYIEGIVNGNTVILSQAITIIESSLTRHFSIAQEIIEKCLPYSGKSIRIGITGVPGVGKSTFIEALGKQITSSGKKLAVLAIDPSSERSKGSILGDKTRMEDLATDVNAYIRPSPSGGSMGGVAKKTRETLILCEAAGFETIFIETVGVGQSEIAVHSMVDFFLLLMLAGAGDELQGIKRGIMEMADAVVINKADGSNLNKVKLAQSQFQNSLRLFPTGESKWIPSVLNCSSINKTGISEIWDNIADYIALTKGNGYFLQKRKNQATFWMYETIHETLKNNFYNQPYINKKLKTYERMVIDGKITPANAVKKLFEEKINQ